MSNNNPYLKIIQIMREQGSYNDPTSFFIGKVVSKEPLLIKVNGLQIDKSDFLISYGLQQSLYIGDSVLVLVSNDKQSFVVANKVVNI